MMRKFSVLMSLYIKEKAEFFSECMESILNQTVTPDEIVIVLDGPISEEVKTVLEKYATNYPSFINVVPLEKNVGLGLALKEGIIHCKNELIARMDTDDICRKDRFELQLMEFEKKPELDICGSHIIEFETDISNILSKRIVPLFQEDIKKYQRQRSAFNHMTVMYKKSAVLKAGNYEDCPLMEDDVLWVKMIRSGAVCSNVDDFLVYARTGKAMIERRGGWSYFKKYRNGRKVIRKTGFISWWDYKKTVCIQFFVALLPKKIRLLFFTKALRKI